MLSSTPLRFKGPLFRFDKATEIKIEATPFVLWKTRGHLKIYMKQNGNSLQRFSTCTSTLILIGGIMVPLSDAITLIALIHKRHSLANKI